MHNMSRGQQLLVIVLISALLIETGVLIFSDRAKKAFDNEIILNTKSLPVSNIDQPKGENQVVMSNAESQPKRIKVYVTGMVKKPGVYEMNDGERIEEAINMAGGITDEGDVSSLNLAQRLKDEDMIYVPQIGETTSIPVIGGAVRDGKVDINSATVEELDKLPGIGPSKAQKIVDYREQNGPFKTIEDIQKVSGIGPQTFETIKELIVVR